MVPRGPRTCARPPSACCPENICWVISSNCPEWKHGHFCNMDRQSLPEQTVSIFKLGANVLSQNWNHWHFNWNLYYRNSWSYSIGLEIHCFDPWCNSLYLLQFSTGGKRFKSWTHLPRSHCSTYFLCNGRGRHPNHSLLIVAGSLPVSSPKIRIFPICFQVLPPLPQSNRSQNI